ncbi:mpv17-like protein isoform X1 [Dermacentor andersoni]|uniref:mpv17-like protein isoform X1 n=1 Tax=Dermacentor andersoni TaxID=34620 RepID=UPI002155DD77|nr:mpv17-like protein isoform X1 [Dermacentor andersoni]
MQRVAAKLGRFAALFRERPLLANMVSYPTLYVAAEFSQQTILMRVDESRRQRGYDWKIMLRYMVFATTVSAPFLLYWYRYLDRVIPARGTKEAIQKALTDQAVSSTIILAVFYPAMSAMEGKEDIFAELKAKFVPTYKLSCCFWIPAQCFNFFLVPPHLRVVTVGICSFAWVNILCIMKRMTIKTHKEDA